MSEETALEKLRSITIKNDQELFLANRSLMYSLFADVFRYPDKEFRDQVRNGDLESTFASIAKALPYPYELSEDERKSLTFPETLTDEDIEVEFIRLFDAGPGDPPCALVEGVYRDGRRTVLKNLILFYNNFGLSYEEGSREDRPDHASYEMEFLHYLTFLNLRAMQLEKNQASYIQAQRDFLEKHPVQWICKLSEQATKVYNGLVEGVNKEVIFFYKNLICLLERFVEADYGYIKSVPVAAANA
jgi:DMSO reductase family type II enzyme chaperone